MDTKAIVDRIDKLLDDFYMPEAVVPNLISAVRLIRRATAALEVATTAAKISSQNLR